LKQQTQDDARDQAELLKTFENLPISAWIQVSNFVGDCTLKQFSFPATNPPIRFFRVKTQ
jgi:hypothetical protein